MRPKTLNTKPSLNHKIILKKKELYKKANQLGLSHVKVVACSQELDLLMNKYQGIFPNNEVR